MSLPYEHATSGNAARQETIKTLKRFGCSSVGFMDEFDSGSVILAFRWRERRVEMRASAQGWANAWLKENPWNRRRKSSQDLWRRRALDQGMVAVSSILRDWVKGQITAVETGILTFDHIFLPHMLTHDGTPAIDVMREKLSLPSPAESQ